ncbi:helix-turn-helix transcriptional regulator [Citrobacter rodentium]|uniref:DNA binding protein n=2 Tax=Citrobacter rodentium TaxID=67825 RepID=D2TIR9_CITRI|nr:DNA-binding protein [Citrobacter rodentium]KIQ50966.1 hypothetical protein TA05_12735 [Citrobacter rodentium]QBY30426.1 hypothetical protein E2R62_17400 [Citrobacter rodentium]UHO32204.1 hypothetical protein K7R23_05760 [Citrobacter rodentium NBRC 105723 = DSM 16636]CBG90829.1 putative DNA binding protein [Citrobacter rodentium ICC168]HAT8012620.1 hypothetical protein [Citrobacter rodentium NBRC 105723 = DSM 16636]
MSIAFLIASENAYFNYGVRLLTDQSINIKCYDFNGLDSLYEVYKKYKSTYLICDKESYATYSFLFEKKPITCICLEQLTLHHGRISIITNCIPSPVSVLKKLTDIETEIIYLYFFKGFRIKAIAAILQLRVSQVYYRIKVVKDKLGADSTRKLPVLLRSLFHPAKP